MVLLVAGVYLLDNYIGFSDFYGYEHKVEQVSKIESMLHRTDLDSTVRIQLKTLEKQILGRKSLFAYLPSFRSLITDTSISKPIQTQKAESAKIIEVERSWRWHTVSSSWAIVLLMIGFLTYTITRKIDASAVGTLIVIEIFLIGIAYGISALLSLIPVLLGNPIYNYLLNFSLSFSMLVIVFWWGNKMNNT